MADEKRFIGKQKKEKRFSYMAVAYSNLALCHLKLKQPNETIENATAAIELDRKNEKTYYRRAQVGREKEYGSCFVKIRMIVKCGV